MSVNPVLAALIGLVILHQPLPGEAWLSIAAIVAANAVSALRRQVPGASAPERASRSACTVRTTAAPMMAAPAIPVALSRSPSSRAARMAPVSGSSRASRAAVLAAVGPQAAEVQRVGHGGRAGAQRDQQADGRGPGPEGDAAR